MPADVITALLPPPDIELPVSFKFIFYLNYHVVSKNDDVVLKTMMSYKSTYFVQKCRCWRPAASHWMQALQGKDGVAPQPFEQSRLSTALLVQPIAIAMLSVCIALLCLSQSESLTGLTVNLHNLKNTTCQILPCSTQPSPSKLCYQRGRYQLSP